jgi:Na+/H+ antiporter
MFLFESTLLLLLGAVLITALARQLDLPSPPLLALAGAAVAFLPFVPVIEVDPDLALALFVAPILLDAAFDTSPHDLRRNALPLASLAIVAVLVTTAAVAVVGWRIAGLPVAAAVALGSIVAPPDAAAATAVLSQLRPPRRITLILQGESLLNDATSLLIYRSAVTMAFGTISLAAVAPGAIVAMLGGIVLGYVLARVYLVATARVEDAASGTVLQFVSTFGVWLLADGIHLSAIITMVVYAMTLARWAPRRSSARNRISSYSVWETAVFVLNVLAFVLMGLQARPILSRLADGSRIEALVLAASVLATVIVVRLVWVLAYGSAHRLLRRLRVVSKDETGTGLRADLLIGWCGMRGPVTLAAAFALPANFPGRDMILLSAFCVVLGTLVLQGMTLKPLLRRLHFEDDASLEEEVSRGRVAVMQAALDSLKGETSHAAEAVREQYAAAKRVAKSADAPQAATDYDHLRLRAVAAQRERLHRLRAEGTIGDETFHRLEEELDWAELDAAPAGRFQPLTT